MCTVRDVAFNGCMNAIRQLPGHRIARGFAIVSVSLLLGGGAWRTWRESAGWQSTDNAYADGPVHYLAARLVGTVDEVLVEENQRVSQGQILIRLDPRDAAAQRDQQQAKLAEDQASVIAADTAVARAKAEARLAVATLAQARLDDARIRRIHASTKVAVAEQELEHSRTRIEVAVANQAAAASAVASAQAETAVARAKAEATEAALVLAELQCERTTLTAPVAGTVGRRTVETGQPVVPAQPLLAVVGQDLWITANFKETQLATMAPGQTARVRFDALPEREWPAVVESLSPASGARFSLLPQDNATGNFTRVVQRIPVRIRLAPEARTALGARLVPGLSAKIRVRVADSMPGDPPSSGKTTVTHR